MQRLQNLFVGKSKAKGVVCISYLKDGIAIGSLSTGVISAGKSCILFGKSLVSWSFDMLMSLGSAGIPANYLIPTPASGTGALGYLSGNWCGTAYDRDPSAYVTFGIYSRNNKKNAVLIYFREVY